MSGGLTPCQEVTVFKTENQINDLCAIDRVATCSKKINFVGRLI